MSRSRTSTRPTRGSRDVNPGAGPLPPSAPCGPAPASEWDRKYWLGSLRSGPVAGAPSVGAVGVTEHKAFATNCDVLVDFSQSTYDFFAEQPILYVAVYAVSHVGGKSYQAQFTASPPHFGQPFPLITATPFPSGVIPPNGRGITAPPAAMLGTRSFIIQATKVGAMLWGTEVVFVSTPGSQPITNVAIASIAHGRELQL